MNAERAAFMAALGITEEDVIDPDHHITSKTGNTPRHKMHKTHLAPDVNEKERTATTTTKATHDMEYVSAPGKSHTHNSSHAISLSSSGSNGLSLSQLSSPKTTQTSFQTVSDSLHNTDYTYNYSTKQNSIPTNTNSAAENDMNRCSRAENVLFANQANKFETNLLPLTLTFHADMRAAEEMKQAGNVAFEVGDFLHSIHHYSHAIDTLTIYAETLPAPESNTQSILGVNANNYAAINNDNDFNSMAANVYAAHIGQHNNIYNSQELIHKDKSKHHKEQQEQQIITLETEELDELVLLLASLHSNRSASFLQAAKLCESIEYAYLHALFDAETTISLRPGWFKGYSRQGDVYFKMKEYHNATEAFAMAVELSPENVNLQHSLEESERRAKQRDCADRTHRSLQPVYHTTRNYNNKKELQDVKIKTNTDILYKNNPENMNKEVNTCTASDKVNDKPNLQTRFKENTATPTGCTLSASVLSSESHLNSLNSNYNDDNNNKTETGKSEVKGQLAKKMWEEFKHEMEITSSTPTGDDYRKAQLAKFRQEQEQKKIKKVTTTETKQEEPKMITKANSNAEPQIIDKHVNVEQKSEKYTTHESNRKKEQKTKEVMLHDENETSQYENYERSTITELEKETPNKLTPERAMQSRVTFAEVSKLNDNDNVKHMNKDVKANNNNSNDLEYDASRQRKSGSIDSNGNSVNHLCEMYIPEEFSSSAAAAYQQKLLAEYRKKKAIHVETNHNGSNNNFSNNEHER